jgi:outer membrane receptor protein involved in Fe transport
MLAHASWLAHKRRGYARAFAAVVGLGLAIGWRDALADAPSTTDVPVDSETSDDAATPETQAPEPPFTEVIVRGHKAPPTAARITKNESKQMPGALGDPFRAIEAVPGVTPIASGLPYFFVRGAPPGNVGYFFDGIRVPLLFHVFFGPSVIHPAMIQKVDVYRGGYPAEYGRFAGAVVAADLEPPRYQWRAETTVRLFDAGAMIEAPLANGAGSIMLAGRYSYTAAIVSALSRFNLAYWDYQGLATYDVGRDDRVSVFAFGSYDHFDQDNAGGLGGSEFHRLDLRYDHAFGPSTRSRIAVTVGHDWTGDPGSSSRDTLVAPRFHFRTRLTSTTMLLVGGDASLDAYSFELHNDALNYVDLSKLFPSRTDRVAGAYAELEWNPEGWYTVTPGVRFDDFRSLGDEEVAVDPRLSARFEVTPSFRIVHALGTAHQSPNFVPGVPAVQLAGIRNGLQSSLQLSSGVEMDLPEGITSAIGVFKNGFFNLSDPLGVSGDVFAHPETAYARSLGSSYGLEVSVQRSLSHRLGGFLSYTLSRTTRSHDRIYTLSAADRPHVVNAAVGYDLGKRWRIGTRLAYASGIPAQRITEEGHIYDGFGRARPFVRVDLRLEKRWVLTEKAWVSVTAELFNATLSTEVTSRTCTANGCYSQELGPVTIPSIGLEAAF